jgi:hypothetical protein
LSVDDLRQQLRDRGYLSHGIERWFALDPWSSRAFWLELATVAAKASTLIALFAVLPLVAVMLFRNHPLTPTETLLITLLYGAAALLVSFVLLIVIALILRLRPTLAVDTPRALLVISFAASGALTLSIAIWWYRFDTGPPTAELLTGLALIVAFFLFASVAISAALLSFSIYELKRVPSIHAKPRTIPMTMAAAFLIAALFLPAFALQEKRGGEVPIQVVTTPTTRHVALIAVDGLTFEILQARRDFGLFVQDAAPVRGRSTTERWATVGTGVKTYLHGVRAVEGVHLRGGQHLLQSVSSADVVLRDIAPSLALARREALPPTVRRRDFVWEILAARGIPSVAVNWWTTDDGHVGALDSVGQTSIFSAAAAGSGNAEAMALRVDSSATKRLLRAIDDDHPLFATIYLPALDVILNRLNADRTTQLTASVQALEGTKATIDALRARGYDVIVAGLPGDGQSGRAAIASTLPLAPTTTPFDIAPTICTLMGFPPSIEMSGRTLIGKELPRVPSYGPRASQSHATKVNQEYYENLRSLGYIR